MPRPNRSAQRRAQYLPAIAEAFAELGYRRATTAELARRLGVQENTLFRLWHDKKAMFLAAIGHVYEDTQRSWAQLLEKQPSESGTAAQRLLAHEAKHHGESKLYRIVFAGLNETDDPDIKKALRRMFKNFHQFAADRIECHRGGDDDACAFDARQAAWGIIGLGLMSDVVRELKLMSNGDMEAVFREIGGQLLNGVAKQV